MTTEKEIFKDQSYLTLECDTDMDLTGVVEAKILYEKPTPGVKGSWSATISGSKLVYNILKTDLDQVGTWSFQSYIRYSDDRIGLGQLFKKEILNNLL
jgi:hypothetical protein